MIVVVGNVESPLGCIEEESDRWVGWVSGILQLSTDYLLTYRHRASNHQYVLEHHHRYNVMGDQSLAIFRS